MDTVKDENFENEQVELDGKEFIGCTFTNCMLVYAGGEVEMNDIQIVNTRLGLSGAAGRTVMFLKGLHEDERTRGMAQDILDQIS